MSKRIEFTIGQRVGDGHWVVLGEGLKTASGARQIRIICEKCDWVRCVAPSEIHTKKLNSCKCKTIKNFKEKRKIKVVPGKKFGRLTVESFVKADRSSKYWKCICECGGIKTVREGDLRAGKTKSCGCLQRQVKDLVGKRFGKLVVKSLNRVEKNIVYWNCVCDCQNKAIVSRKGLESGNTKSCGCFRGEKNRKELEGVIGKRFGKLIVVSFSEENKKEWARFDCICDCGGIKDYVRLSDLTKGDVRSCGCLIGNDKKDILGQRFGKLVVVEFVEIRKGRAYWKTQCDCGNEKIISVSGLTNGTKSCGCLPTGRKKSRKNKGLLHNEPCYGIWKGMKDRCTKPNHHAFSSYGGRGITVDPRWMASYDAFIEDVGPRPSLQHSLDRIDVDKGYYPENVRWATFRVQVSNRRMWYHVKKKEYQDMLKKIEDLESENQKLQEEIFKLRSNTLPRTLDDFLTSERQKCSH